MNPEEIQKEKSHLAVVVQKVSFAHDSMTETIEKMGNFNLTALKDLRENPETSDADFLMFITKLHEQNEAFNLMDKYQRLSELEYLKEEPYFARIDLTNPDNSESKQFYIGKFGFSDDARSDPVVVDWRAKVASVFYRYRYPQKNVYFESPEGKQVRDLDLKRTFEISEGSLLKAFNNDLQLDESQIIADKIKERTGGVLEDIIETIQEGQHEIIEADPRKICIVQGCVGSGKSTVAIHKLSHIFFNYPELIKPERSILVAKSGILVSYLATLFPKLGIFNINYKTLRELLVNVKFREDISINMNFDINQDISDMTLKEINKLREDIEDIHLEYADRLKRLVEKDLYVTLASFVYSPRVSVRENIDELIHDLNQELLMQKEHLKENPKSARAWIYKENITNLKKFIVDLQKVKKDLKQATLEEMKEKWGLSELKTYGYRESLIYFYIHHELFGFTNSPKYQYCVVDEGQDFSAFEYLLLGKMVMNGRFCILGDLNQSYQKEGLTRWEEISQVIQEAKDAQTFELVTNYRSTKPIITLANKILEKHTKDYLPSSINRQGPEPVILKGHSEESLLRKFEELIEDDLSNLNKSIGVIVFDDKYLEDASRLLNTYVEKKTISPNHFIVLDEHKRISYIPNGVYFTHFDHCKGLEFSKVYVLGLDIDKVSTFLEAKRAFVAVTRAMNEVVILG